jgi:5-methyltetrahydrofolate corrinoid/iron sulfur protein methyltransferase
MIVIADNLQATLPETRAALDRNDPEPVRELVRRMERAGARMIDINPGPLKRDAAARMAFLVQAVQSASDLPLLIDTADPAVMEAGLAAGRKPLALNGFSLEPRKVREILPLAVRHGADIVGYLLDARGLPPASVEERLGIAVELLDAARAAGLPSERLIIDPVVAPLIWEEGHRRNAVLLEVLRGLPEVLGFPVRTVAGLSNLTSGSPAAAEKKQRVEGAFLAMLAAAGLDMALLNVFHGETVRLARTCETLLSQKVFSWESL